MSFTENQRKGYLLAIALMVIAIALVCGWMLRPDRETESAFIAPTAEVTASPAPEPSASPTDEASSANAQAANPEKKQKVSTIVYYQDNDGYLVPVMCSVPMEDGIAKATLSMMVQSTGNDMQAARLGLRTVLPENTKIDLDIANGLARIDLSREVLQLPDAAAESNMVSAVVGALTEFDTVKEVEFLIGGQKLEKLPIYAWKHQSRNGGGRDGRGEYASGHAVFSVRGGRSSRAGYANGLFRAGSEYRGAGADKGPEQRVFAGERAARGMRTD